MANFWAKSDLKSDPPPLGMSGLKPTAVLSEPPTNIRLPMLSNLKEILYLKGCFNLSVQKKPFRLENAVLHHVVGLI